MSQEHSKLQNAIDLLLAGVAIVRTRNEAAGRIGGSRRAHSIKWWLDTAENLAIKGISKDDVNLASRKSHHVSSLFLMPKKSLMKIADR